MSSTFVRHCCRLIVRAIATLALLSTLPAGAQTLSLNRNLYAAAFTCGSQRPLSINVQPPVEAGIYAFNLSVFNAAASNNSTISVLSNF